MYFCVCVVQKPQKYSENKLKLLTIELECVCVVQKQKYSENELKLLTIELVSVCCAEAAEVLWEQAESTEGSQRLSAVYRGCQLRYQ